VLVILLLFLLSLLILLYPSCYTPPIPPAFTNGGLLAAVFSYSLFAATDPAVEAV